VITIFVAFVAPVAVALVSGGAAIATEGDAKVVFAVVSAAALLVVLWDIVILGVIWPMLSDTIQSALADVQRRRERSDHEKRDRR
jgi:hypothetical protein